MASFQHAARNRRLVLLALSRPLLIVKLKAEGRSDDLDHFMNGRAGGHRGPGAMASVAKITLP